MSLVPKKEVWLRGPLPGIPALVMPVAHALLQASEEVTVIMEGFPDELLWERPAGLASPGFHLQHLSGVLDRMFTYAENRELSEVQINNLSMEGKDPGNLDGDHLVRQFSVQVETAIGLLREIDEQQLTELRWVGRARIPSSLIGLLVHAAEHTQRHVGQLLVTTRVLKFLHTSGT